MLLVTSLSNLNWICVTIIPFIIRVTSWLTFYLTLHSSLLRNQLISTGLHLHSAPGLVRLLPRSFSCLLARPPALPAQPSDAPLWTPLLSRCPQPSPLRTLPCKSLRYHFWPKITLSCWIWLEYLLDKVVYCRWFNGPNIFWECYPYKFLTLIF